MYGQSYAKTPGENKFLDILAMGCRERDSRTNWTSLWEELAELFYPSRQGFLGKETEGDEQRERIYTSHPELARRALQTSVSMMLRPAGTVWFRAKTRKHALNQLPHVKGWLDAVTAITFENLYDPRAKAESNLAMLDADLVSFGTGSCRVGWNVKEGHYTFKTKHLANVVYMTNHAGVIDMGWGFTMMTLSQIEEQFGEEKFTPKMLEAWNQGEFNKKFEICHAYGPNRHFQSVTKQDPIRKPFMSLWFAVAEKELIDMGGFWSFPDVAPRWDLSSGEVYGRSPAMVALNDARLSNEVHRTMIEAGENAVRPPMGAWSDMISGEVELFAGGLTMFDKTGNWDSKGPPIWAVENGVLPREIMEFAGMVDERVSAAFYRDVLELPNANEKDLTATEINARLDQYQRQAAPVFARINDDYNSQLCNRLFVIGQEQGQYPDPPEELLDEEIEFEYESPLTVLRKKSQAMKTLEGLGHMAQFAAMLPEDKAIEVYDHMQIDNTTRYFGHGFDLPGILMAPADEVVAARDSRAEQMQMMQMAEMAKMAGPAAAQMGGLALDAANSPAALEAQANGQAGDGARLIEGTAEEVDAAQNPDTIENGGSDFDLDEMLAV